MATKKELRKVAEEMIEILDLKEKGVPIVVTDDTTSDEIMTIIASAVKLLEPPDKFTKETEAIILEFEDTGITNKRLTAKKDAEELKRQEEEFEAEKKKAKKEEAEKLRKEKAKETPKPLSPQQVADKLHKEMIADSDIKTVLESPPVNEELKISETFHAACPPLEEEEFNKLEALIVKDGKVLSPIITWNGFIVDGHNRYAIARKHTLNYTTREKTFGNENEVVLWIKENAVSQRNLPDFAKFELVKDIEILLRRTGKEHQGRRKLGDKKHDTRKELAKKAGISPTQVAKAKVIEEKADEETKEKLRKGKTTIGKVYTEVKPNTVGKNKDGFSTGKMESAVKELNAWIKKFEKDDEMANFTTAINDIIILIENRIDELKGVGK